MYHVRIEAKFILVKDKCHLDMKNGHQNGKNSFKSWEQNRENIKYTVDKKEIFLCRLYQQVNFDFTSNWVLIEHLLSVTYLIISDMATILIYQIWASSCHLHAQHTHDVKHLGKYLQSYSWKFV